MVETADPIFAVIPLVAATALLALTVVFALRDRREGRALAFGRVAWPLAFVAYLVFIAVWCARGWLQASIGALDLIVWSAVQAVCGAATLLRRPFFAWLDSLPRPVAEGLRVVRDIVVLLCVSIVSALIIDIAWSTDPGAIPVRFVEFTAVLFAAFGVIAYALGQRTGLAMCLVPIAAAGFGVAQYFVVQLKGAAILPSDLLALGTAAAVAGAYDFILTPQIFYVLCVVGVCVCALSFVWPSRPQTVRGRVVNVAVNLIAGLALLCGGATVYQTAKVDEVLGFTYDRWQPIETYRNCGFVPSFVSLLQDFAIPVPEGYSRESAQELQDELASQFDAGMGAAPGRAAAEAQFGEIKPTVITVMNETFTDLSLYEGLRDAGYAGPVGYKSLAGTLQRGTLMSSVMGGGTANTEFEFLTGNSSAFIGFGKYPYQLYDLSGVDSLAAQLSDLGYATTAMHPQLATNYNRSNVYPELGFDEFLSIEDFGEVEQYHAGARDKATYDKILELLANDEAPQFIFDLTMQNHSGYDPGTVPAEDVARYAPAGVTDEALLGQLDTYLACIEQSDKDLMYFIDRLRELSRPVVLVFFGDHQPAIAAGLNDAVYPNEDPFTHEIRTYESTYMVWANYEVAGAPLDVQAEVGAAQLAAQVLYRIGAPLSDYQKAQLVLDQQVPSVSLLGYRGADGLRYALEAESPYKEAVNQMATLQYENFARKVQ
ncbi:MAG: LTA synthase family protein [Coriobacteriaceae bacterium]|nr:LTA synthase family protein [Coriobacteriaceae bacterium]